MKWVFVDTGAWYALADSQDPDHPAACAFLTENRLPMVTTNFVFDESVTLIRRRLGWKAAHDFGNRLKKSDSLRLLPISPTDEELAWEIFGKYRDQDFSYTDCTSFAVMQRLSLDQAFTFDRHFAAMRFQVSP